MKTRVFLACLLCLVMACSSSKTTTTEKLETLNGYHFRADSLSMKAFQIETLVIEYDTKRDTPVIAKKTQVIATGLQSDEKHEVKQDTTRKQSEVVTAHERDSKNNNWLSPMSFVYVLWFIILIVCFRKLNI